MVERLGWTLVHFVWEGAAVALLLAVALGLAGKHSARLRYTLACLALIVLAAAPALTYQALKTTESVVALSGAKRWIPGETILAGGETFDGLLPILVRVWVVGVVLLSLRLGGALLHVERWRRQHTQPAAEEWQRKVDDLAQTLGIRRRIGVLVSDRIAVPSAWGVLKAFVVLPTSLLTALPPAQVETILLHELAHIRRHDYLVNLLQAVAETVLFYHPAVWWVSAVVRREREHCCDDVVVARLADPMPYARALLHLEERRLTLPRPTLSAKEGNLMNRIARILTPQPAPRRVSPLASSLAAAAVLAAVLGGTLQAQAQGKAPAAPKKPAAVAAAPKPVKNVTIRTTAKPAPASAAKKTLKTAPRVTERPAPAISVFETIPAMGGFGGSSFGEVQEIRSATQGKTAIATTKPAPRTIKIAGVTKTAARQGGGFGGGLPAATPGLGGIAGGSGQGFGGGGFGGGVAVASPGAGGLGGGGFGGGGIAAATGGFPGYRANSSDDLIVEVDADKDSVRVDVDHAPLSAVLRTLVRRTHASVVITKGIYEDVTMVLNDVSFDKALEVICKAGGATFRVEGNVIYIVPRD